MSERIATCYEVASRVSERLRAEFDEIDHYVLGGIATGAIADFESVDTRAREVVPTKKSDLPVFRKNKSLRDIDVLVHSEDPGVLKDAARLAIETAAGDMRVDVFGLDRLQTEEAGAITGINAAWTSRRALRDDGKVMHVLLPYMAEIPESGFEPWRIRPQDMPDIAVLEPYYHLLCYDLRSIGGPRPKDQEKLVPVRTTARTITEASGTDLSAYEDLERMKLSLERLRNQGIISARQNNQLGLFLRSKISAFGESQRWVVDAFQTPLVQKLVRRKVGAQKQIPAKKSSK